MKSEAQIRIAKPEESDAIAVVLREAFAEFEPRYTPEAFAATTPCAEEIRKRFDEDEGAIWVALKNERIVGTVSAVAKGVRLYVRSMAVLPAAQGLGAGRGLLDAVEKFAVENEFKCLFLYTVPFLAGAIRLYEQNGFTHGEEQIEGFFGTPWFAMEKKL